MDDPINHILQADLADGVQNLCVYVLHNADEDGWCRDKQDEIAEHLGVSRSTVSRRESKTDYLVRDGHQVRVVVDGEAQSVPQTSQKCEATAQKCEADGTLEGDSGECESDGQKCEDSAQKCEAGGTLSGVSVMGSGRPGSPPRQKEKFSHTLSKRKSSTPCSDTPSLSSVVSGDGAPSHADPTMMEPLPEDDTKHPAVGIFASKAHLSPGEYDRKRLIEIVGQKDTERFSNRIGLWRKTVEEWRQHDYNWSNFDGLLDRYTQKLENYGIINRSDYNGGLDLPEGEDVTAKEAGYAHLLEEG